MAEKIVGVHASRAVRTQRTGTENYSWEILCELIRLKAPFTWRLYAPHKPKEPFPETTNVEWDLIEQRRLWSQVALATELKKSKPNLLFVPSHVMPFLTTVPTVVTIHDLAYELFPYIYSAFDRRYMRLTNKFAVKKAKKIIVPSAQTKQDLIQLYHVNPDKVVVVPLGYRKPTIEPTALPIHTDEPYFFYVNRVEQRKNPSLIIEAFTLLQKKHPHCRLIIAGKPGYGYSKIMSEFEALDPKVKDKIIFLGFISDEEKFRYIRHAQAFLCPSLYEGFGIPLLEAFAIDCPVISSNASSLPEVAGEAAILLSPTDPKAWASEMEKILLGKTDTKTMIQKGRAQTEKFSWKRCAEETLQVLTDALE